MRRYLAELCGRDSARGARLGENNLRSVREEYAGDFVDRFVAQRSVEHEKPAVREVFFPKQRQLARGSRVVRAIQIDIRTGVQLFQTARPSGRRDSVCDAFVRDAIALPLQE